VPRVLALFLPFLPLAAHAQGTTAPVPELGGGLGQMLFGLAVVIAILFATLWVLKRLSVPRGGNVPLNILGATAVGPRERVVLVELAGKVLVLGVTQSSVQTLHVLDAAELPPAAPQASTGRDFSAWLRQSVERRTKHER
jgi:flagellar protein FliO/FliZ